jgi:hypothetical protein
MTIPVPFKLSRLILAILITIVVADARSQSNFSTGLVDMLGNRTIALLTHERPH